MIKKDIINLLEQFEPISQAEMDGVSLMNRIDTKYIINEKDLIVLLENIKETYRVLEKDSTRIFTYTSLYFDTYHKKFFQDHHNRNMNRTKVRIRKYLDSDRCYLEIKQKDGKSKSTKKRKRISDFESKLSANSQEFIKKTTSIDLDLQPSIWNSFNRITLVNIKTKERLKIDLNLNFKKAQKTKNFERLVIIELMQERFERTSKVVSILKSLHINPYRLSKYCIGMVSVNNNLKYNRFKKKLLKIDKLIN